MLGFDALSSLALGALPEAGAPAPETVTRDPVFTRIQRRAESGSLTVGANLLLTTLAVAAAVSAPVGKSSFEMPVAREAIQHEVGRQSLALTNQPAVAPPFAEGPEYRRPVLVVQQPQVGPNLLTGTLYVAPVIGTEQTRQPVFTPRFAKSVQQPQAVGSRLALTTVTVAAKPFANAHENPARARKVAQWQQPTNYLPLGIPSLPYRASDEGWNNPVRSRYVQQPEVVQNVLLRGFPTVQVAAPFKPVDLANPARRKSVQQPLHIRGQEAVVVVPGTPFRPVDAPNPVLARKVQQQQPAQNTLLLGYPTPTVTADVPGWNFGKKHRRSYIINGQRYIGTEREIRHLLLELLDAEEEVEPVKVNRKFKIIPNPKPIELAPREEKAQLPADFNFGLYRSLLKDSYAFNDPALTFMLRQILSEYEDEEDMLFILANL